MANDREVLRLIWDGKIPICFIPDPTEIEVSQHPEPMFLMVSRLTYLPLVTEKVTKHFCRHVNNEHQDEVWFECNGRALKWNCPIGESLFLSSCSSLILLLLLFQESFTICLAKRPPMTRRTCQLWLQRRACSHGPSLSTLGMHQQIKSSDVRIEK